MRPWTSQLSGLTERLLQNNVFERFDCDEITSEIIVDYHDDFNHSFSIDDKRVCREHRLRSGNGFRATGLNVRSGPGTTNSIITTISNGDIVVILEKTSDIWYKINAQGTEGYVAARYLKDVLTAENFSAYGALADRNVRMRNAPSLSGDIIGMYSTGTTLPVIGINSGWYKLRDGDKVGYIRSDLINIVSGCDTERAVATVSGGTTSLGREIADYAQGFVGYRYVYGAESPSVGFDCSGLVYYVYGQFGYSLSRGGVFPVQKQRGLYFQVGAYSGRPRLLFLKQSIHNPCGSLHR